MSCALEKRWFGSASVMDVLMVTPFTQNGPKAGCVQSVADPVALRKAQQLSCPRQFPQSDANPAQPGRGRGMRMSRFNEMQIAGMIKKQDAGLTVTKVCRNRGTHWSTGLCAAIADRQPCQLLQTDSQVWRHGRVGCTTWFLPVDPIYQDTFFAWVNHLLQDRTFRQRRRGVSQTRNGGH